MWSGAKGIGLWLKIDHFQHRVSQSLNKKARGIPKARHTNKPGAQTQARAGTPRQRQLTHRHKAPASTVKPSTPENRHGPRDNILLFLVYNPGNDQHIINDKRASAGNGAATTTRAAADVSRQNKDRISRPHPVASGSRLPPVLAVPYMKIYFRNQP